MARIVVVEETGMGSLYTVPVVAVGSEPSVVYRISAPAVDVDRVTDWASA